MCRLITNQNNCQLQLNLVPLSNKADKWILVHFLALFQKIRGKLGHGGVLIN